MLLVNIGSARSHIMARMSGSVLTAKIKTLKSHTITFRGRSIIIKPGDDVMMQTPNYLTEPNYIAKIANILATTRYDPHVRVEIYWYYRPEDADGGRKSFHGRKELFFSDHVDTQFVDTIIGKCNVYTMDEFKKLDKVEANDFFCRYKYHCLTGAFSPDSVTVYCKCDKPENPDIMMLDCEKCGERFHPACVHLTAEKARRVKNFFCKRCLSKKRRHFLRNSGSTLQDGDAESSNVRCRLQDGDAVSSNVRRTI